jgi:hypothetical protein
MLESMVEEELRPIVWFVGDGEHHITWKVN